MKKSLLSIVLFLSSLCLFSQRNINYDFTLIKSVRLPFDDNGLPLLSYDKSQYVLIDKRETIIVGTVSNRLLFYDLNSAELYHEIALPEALDYSFQFISKDSIFLATTKGANSIIRLDYNGKILQTHDFTKSKKDGLVPAFMGNTLQVHNGKSFTRLNGPSDLIGTKKFWNSTTPTLGMLDLKRELIVPSKSLRFPELTLGKYYPNDIPLLYHCIGSNGNPIVRYFYSNSIYEWIQATDSYVQHALPSQLIDEVPANTEPISQSDFTLPYHYGPISCDTLRGFYYSQVQFNANFYGENVWSLIVADKDFKILCEKLNPPFSGTLLFSDQYIISLTNQGEGFIEYGFYKLTPSSLTLAEEAEQSKNELLKRMNDLPATNQLKND